MSRVVRLAAGDERLTVSAKRRASVRRFFFDNVAKSGIASRGVGLSQTDNNKKLRPYI